LRASWPERLERQAKRWPFRRKPAPQLGWTAGTSGTAETIKGEAESTEPAGRQPAALWWRVSVLEPGGRSVEVDTPSGWTMGKWAAYAARYHGRVVTAVLPLPKPLGTGEP
jgi:hypothetical protein